MGKGYLKYVKKKVTPPIRYELKSVNSDDLFKLVGVDRKLMMRGDEPKYDLSIPIFNVEIICISETYLTGEIAPAEGLEVEKEYSLSIEAALLRALHALANHRRTMYPSSSSFTAHPSIITEDIHKSVADIASYINSEEFGKYYAFHITVHRNVPSKAIIPHIPPSVSDTVPLPTVTLSSHFSDDEITKIRGVETFTYIAQNFRQDIPITIYPVTTMSRTPLIVPIKVEAILRGGEVTFIGTLLNNKKEHSLVCRSFIRDVVASQEIFVVRPAALKGE